jgi:hypothetical protein
MLDRGINQNGTQQGGVGLRRRTEQGAEPRPLWLPRRQTGQHVVPDGTVPRFGQRHLAEGTRMRPQAMGVPLDEPR